MTRKAASRIHGLHAHLLAQLFSNNSHIQNIYQELVVLPVFSTDSVVPLGGSFFEFSNIGFDL